MEKVNVEFRYGRLRQCFHVWPAVYVQKNPGNKKWGGDMSISLSWLWWSVGVRFERKY
jgi:hypothetical protein